MQDNIQTFTVAEAAAALGVSTDAIRKRLARGTLIGEKVEGVWKIALDIPSDTQPETSDSGRTTASGDPEDPYATIADLRARLDWSQSEITALRAAADRARERADVLSLNYQGAQERIRELEALTSGITAANEAVESPVSPGNDATHISTRVEPDTARRGALQRLWRALVHRE